MSDRTAGTADEAPTRERQLPRGRTEPRTLMELNLHEWGDPAAPPVVCLHGVNAHGRRFRKLAEEGLAPRYRGLAPDLRRPGTSGWEPPRTFDTHAHDVPETPDAAP